MRVNSASMFERLNSLSFPVSIERMPHDLRLFSSQYLHPPVETSSESDKKPLGYITYIIVLHI